MLLMKLINRLIMNSCMSFRFSSEYFWTSHALFSMSKKHRRVSMKPFLLMI